MNITKAESFSANRLKLKSPFLSTLLFTILVSSNLFPAEVISATVLSLLFFLTYDPVLKTRYSILTGFGKFRICCLLGIILIGLIGSSNNSTYNIVKDLWYFTNPVLTIYFGYLLMSKINNIILVLRIFLLSATVVSLIHISNFLLDPNLVNESYLEIRMHLSAGYVIAAIAPSIIVGAHRARIRLFNKTSIQTACFAICFISIILSFSRTLWAIFIITTLFTINIIRVKTLLRFSIISFLLIIILAQSASIHYSHNDNLGNNNFHDKVFYSFKEVLVKDYTDMSQINANWRGFESYQALQQYLSGTLSDYLFGQGLGTSVKLNMVMTLAENDFTEIPILHNGYWYLLIKTGIIGLSLYILFLSSLIRKGFHATFDTDKSKALSGKMLIALALALFATTIVITGIYNKSAMFVVTLMIGIILSHLRVQTEFGANIRNQFRISQK